MLEAYGSRRYVERMGEPAAPGALLPARILWVDRERYGIVTEEGEEVARLKGSYLHGTADRTDYPTVGDYVWTKPNPGGEALIAALMPRFSRFARTDHSGHAAGYVKTVLEQNVAANFDVVMILSSLNHDFNLARIQRYLVTARQSGGEPVVVLTKADLCGEGEAYRQRVREIAGEAPVLVVSAANGKGLEQLAPYRRQGNTLIFLGSSGVGKSSLVNALAGREVMAVSGIREDDSRGRHTTTRRQMIRLPGDTLVIDTPGMRELGIGDSGKGLKSTFADVEELIGQCRFRNCQHGAEPGCAVRAALEAGALAPKRWQQYRRLAAEQAFTRAKARKR